MAAAHTRRANVFALAVAACGALHVAPHVGEVELTQWTLSKPAAHAALGANDQERRILRRLGAGIRVNAPCTVFACLMQVGEYPDIFYGTNLAQVNANATIFNTSFTYTTAITTDASASAATFILRFEGLNYRANVHIDGVSVCDNTTCVGAFVYFELDVTAQLRAAGTHTVTVDVFPQHDRSLPATNRDTDLGITFVDWAPLPPDNSMGLWRRTFLHVSPLGVTVTSPLLNTSAIVAPVTGGTVNASLTIGAVVRNWRSVSVTCVVNATLRDTSNRTVATVVRTVTLPTRSAMDVALTASVVDAHGWWPAQMGIPYLHVLTMSVSCDGAPTPTEAISVPAGIRVAASALDGYGNRYFTVNDRRVLVRGAGWSPDLFLRFNASILAAQMRYVTSMGLNTLRLEGKFEFDEFFDVADAAGVLVLPGICCCDAWQHWSLWGTEQVLVSNASMWTQARRIRGHASALGFFISSDELPPAGVEEEYDAALAGANWPNAVISSAAAVTSPVTGPSGVKMSGPYSWVAPAYWLQDDGRYNLGGAWGFLTEGGPGETPLTPESLRSVTPAADLWPPAPDDCWGHCGNTEGMFGDLHRFNAPLAARYGNASNVDAYLWLAAAAAYEGHRAMFEGYTRNKHASATPASTGVIQWMLTNAWPENIWHLFQYDLTPGATFFAAQRACEAVHVLYAYDNASVAVANSRYVPTSPAHVYADVFASNGSLVMSFSAAVPSIVADGVVSPLALPSPATMRARLGRDATYFMRLLLTDNATAQLVSRNVYWLSTEEDVADWGSSTWYNTPYTAYANYSALRTLPPIAACLRTTSVVVNASFITVNVSNAAPAALAFLVRLRALQADGVTDVRPALWSDNYITVFAGETVVVTLDLSLTPDIASTVTLLAEPFNDIAGNTSAPTAC